MLLAAAGGDSSPVKVVLGGLLVAGFAVLSDVLKPKRFGGMLSAAPSVAIAGIAVSSVAKGPASQAAAATTMVAGAAGLTVYALLAVPLLDRVGLARTAVLASLGWLVVTAAVYLVVS